MEPNFDSHCQVFTNKDNFNLRLIIQLILSLPNIAGDQKSSKNLTPYDIKEKNITLRRILNHLKVGFSDSEDTIYGLMQQVYQNNYKIAPYMFDIESCFVSNRSGEKRIATCDIQAVQQQFDEIIHAFNKENLEFIDNALNLVSSKNYDELPEGTTINLQELYQVNYEISQILNEFNDTRLNFQALLISLISSYEIQLRDISQLKANHPQTVFPFIAIDPRRKGIIDRFIREIYPKQIFCGVKLYTPNGYSPSDDDLMKTGGLYDFCCKNNVPITAHNSNGGFASPLKEIEIFGDIYLNNEVIPVHDYVTFKKAFTKDWVNDRAEKLNHPDIWEHVVLKKYPNLKLNLAHFGNDSPLWQEKVYNMTLKYPNFYTDLSCWTNKEELKKFHDKFFTTIGDNRFKQKVLYGSDFYLDLLFIDSFQEYFNNFLLVFSAEEFTQIALNNAKRFLFGNDSIPI
jgi:predicted TIM-barrel fold metal-dependent hydrolase